MSHSHRPPDSVLEKAVQDVAGFALASLELDYLLWNKDVNLGLAQYAWNAKGPLDVALGRYGRLPDARMRDLLRTLLEARRGPWADRTFTLHDLDAHVEDGGLVFTFELSWDGGDHRHPCGIVVGGPHEGAAPDTRGRPVAG